jgi:Holliday junction resolvasome RuvABC endonuclease subunit
MVIKTTPKTPMSQRLQKIRDSILDVLQEHRPDDVVAEQFNIGPTKRSRVAQTFYLHGIVGLHLVEHGFRDPLMIAPPTLKKWWGASGADKEGVRAGIEEFLGLSLHEDHNVVDAVGLAIMLMQRHLWMAGRFSPDRYQKEKMSNWQRML